MYITVKSLKKTLGKFIEVQDLYVGLPMLMSFLILFSFTKYKIISLIFLTICVFLLIPVQVSKKNRMYKVVILLFKYLFSTRNYYYSRKEEKEKWIQIIKTIRR